MDIPREPGRPELDPVFLRLGREVRTWAEAERIYDKEKCALLYQLFEDLYEHEFDTCESFCQSDPVIRETVARIRSLGLRTAVATNPLFPELAMRKRLMWSGVPAEWFETITTYENSRFCKPNPAYFTETAEKLGVKPEECLMVGNDMTEDLAARKAGMEVFIVTDCLINKQGIDMDTVPHGNWRDLRAYIDRLPR